MRKTFGLSFERVILYYLLLLGCRSDPWSSGSRGVMASVRHGSLYPNKAAFASDSFAIADEAESIAIDGEEGSDLILKQMQGQPVADDAMTNDDEENIDKTIDWIKKNPTIFKRFLSYMNDGSMKNNRKRDADEEAEDDADLEAETNDAPAAKVSPRSKDMQPVDPQMTIDPALLYADILARVNAIEGSHKMDKEAEITASTFYNSLLRQLLLLDDSSDREQKSANPTYEPASVAPAADRPGVDKILKNINSPCKNIDPTNVTSLLDRVLQELELIRASKAGTTTPEGTACNIVGTWIADYVGVKFTIAMKKGTDLDVKMASMQPPKPNPIIDPGWSTSGFTLHQTGGPLYLTAFKKQDQAMATFTGEARHNTATSANTFLPLSFVRFLHVLWQPGEYLWHVEYHPSSQRLSRCANVCGK